MICYGACVVNGFEAMRKRGVAARSAISLSTCRGRRAAAAAGEFALGLALVARCVLSAGTRGINDAQSSFAILTQRGGVGNHPYPRAACAPL